MKRKMKKHVAKILTLVMMLSTIFSASLFMANNAKAATTPLPSDLNITFGTKYSGEVDALYNADSNSWNIEYFNVTNPITDPIIDDPIIDDPVFLKKFEKGDLYFVSFKISGASNFKQIAVQSSVNNWDWVAAPKVWADNGISDYTTVSGILEATTDSTEDNENVAFKMHLDNEVTASGEDFVPIALENLYIVKIASGSDPTAPLPEDLQLNFSQKYEGTLTAEADENEAGVYNLQYFNVNASAYDADDIFVVAAKVSGASDFKQVAIQNSVNGWDWAGAAKVWQNDGLPDGQMVGGGFTAFEEGLNQAFKIRFDNGTASAPAPEVTLNNLIVVNVSDLLS